MSTTKESANQSSASTSDPPSVAKTGRERERSMSFETPHVMPELEECPTPHSISMVIATAVGAAALAPTPGVYEHNDLANALDYTIADMRKWPKMSLFNEDLVCMEREEIEGLSKLALVKLAKQYRVGSERGPARMAKEDLRAYLIQMQCELKARLTQEEHDHIQKVRLQMIKEREEELEEQNEDQATTKHDYGNNIRAQKHQQNQQQKDEEMKDTEDQKEDEKVENGKGEAEREKGEEKESEQEQEQEQKQEQKQEQEQGQKSKQEEEKGQSSENMEKNMSVKKKTAARELSDSIEMVRPTRRTRQSSKSIDIFIDEAAAESSVGTGSPCGEDKYCANHNCGQACYAEFCSSRCKSVAAQARLDQMKIAKQIEKELGLELQDHRQGKCCEHSMVCRSPACTLTLLTRDTLACDLPSCNTALLDGWPLFKYRGLKFCSNAHRNQMFKEMGTPTGNGLSISKAANSKGCAHKSRGQQARAAAKCRARKRQLGNKENSVPRPKRRR